MKINEYDYAPIGARIKNARQMRKLTQEAVAEKLNVSCQHISEIERGLSGLSLSSLIQICKVLDVDADYILFGTYTRDAKNPINSILTKMTPEQSKCAEELIRVYAKSLNIV